MFQPLAGATNLIEPVWDIAQKLQNTTFPTSETDFSDFRIRVYDLKIILYDLKIRLLLIKNNTFAL
ncbi:MAG: hypothetical protein LH628_01575, partial [Microcoleus sp. CAN_BIN18]|nr:hypothetical protein [Microcoleus sp. CAN_BIN18]